MKNRKGAIIIGCDFQALGLVRSLAENNIPIFLIEHEKGICRYSKYVKRREINNTIYNEKRFSSYLIDLCKRENLNGWIIFPNNDELVALLAKHKETLSPYFTVSVPSWNITKQIYYKHLTNRIVCSADISTPKLYFGKILEDFLEQKINFPIVLKPSYKEKYFPYVKKKAIRVNNMEEFKIEYNKMSIYMDPEEIIVQEMILGGPKNLYSYATIFDNGHIIAGMAAKRLRQHPMDFGQATTYAVSVNEPDLAELTTKILRKLNYSGIAEVEFMKDEKDGLFKFIEINGRVWGWHTLAKASGVNLPFLLYEHLRGYNVKKIKAEENVKWIRLITDIPTVIKEILNRRITLNDYMKSYRGKKEYAVMSIKDPLPFLCEYALIPYLFYKRGF